MELLAVCKLTHFIVSHQHRKCTAN